MLFVHLVNLLVRTYFCVGNELVVLVLIGTLFIETFVKGIFVLERGIVPIWSGSRRYYTEI